MDDDIIPPLGPREDTRLRKLAEAGFASSVKIPALDELCIEAKAHFGTSMAAVTLLTKDIQVLKSRIGIDVDQTPRNLAFCNYTILEDRVFVVLDTLNDERFNEHPYTKNDPFIRFYAGAPLTYLTDVHLGAFCLLDSNPRADFSRGDMAELTDYADQAVQIMVEQLVQND